MMLPDGHRWVVVAKRDGVVLETRPCAGKHLVPTVMAALAFRYLGGVELVAHAVTFTLVKTEPDAPELARGDAS